MKRVIVTGAGGFIGRHLCDLLIEHTDWHLVLVDHALDNGDYPKDRVDLIEGQLQDPHVLNTCLGQPCNILIHLAALPGGAAEQNPALSKTVNLTATLDMIERAASHGNCPRVVFSSTIAVLGAPMPEVVDDSSPIVPTLTYGTHKAMVELALADMSRRGLIDSIAIRLPGIIARPLAPSGLKSAFLSNVFHHLARNKPFVSPVSQGATTWLMSVQACAQNLLHATTLSSNLMPASRVVTLPALRIGMKELVTNISEQAGTSGNLVSWQPEEALEQVFGRYPKLLTPAADKAGFRHDGSIQQLVANGLLLV